MTSRERLLAVLHGRMPDCVPCDPDISNMIPARLTGEPFWDVYVYQNPPRWKAYIDAIRKFDIDGGIEIYGFGDLFETEHPAPQRRIVHRYDDGGFVTRDFSEQTGEWSRHVQVHSADNPPSSVLPVKIGLPEVPSTWEPVEGVRPWPRGYELWRLIKRELGDQGVLAMSSGASTLMIHNEEELYDFTDNPGPYYERRDRMLAEVERRMKAIAALEERPDFLTCGGSGSLIWQTPAILRELALPVVKKATEMARDLGIPTHVHSCGPERELVKMMAEETCLSIIDPLEVRPMGDCDLGEIKRLYGDRLALKGNLHTTEVMLRGSAADVVAASRQAIDEAARGGGFILSTGDQCGRDTPYENLHAMVETARTYGRY